MAARLERDELFRFGVGSGQGFAVLERHDVIVLGVNDQMGSAQIGRRGQWIVSVKVINKGLLERDGDGCSASCS